MARFDDFTLVRLAQFGTNAGASQSPTERMLRGLDGMWDSDDAVQFEANFVDDRAKTWMPARGWRGSGGPKTLRRYKGAAGGEGQNRTSSRYDARPVTIPLAENNANKDEKEKLRGLLWPDEVVVNGVPHQGLLAAGFRQTTRTDSRYLLDVSDEGSFDMQQRGHKTYSVSPLKMISTWPWYVRPRTASSGTAFVPGGDGPRIIWGVYWGNALSGNITIALNSGGVQSNHLYTVSNLASPFFCFSPPFREIPDGIFPSTASVRLRPYLTKGVSTTITVSPAAATIFYFENYGSP